MTSVQRPARQSAVRRYTARGVAIVIVLSAYGLARIPTPGNAERAALASRFHFTPIQIPDFPGTSARTVRQLQPALSHVSAWFSSMGASVALNDLDGDGLPNDACLVDPRSDRVIVMPVPGTGDRYRPFVVGEAESAAATAPTGCAPADMNEDGHIDLLVHYWGRPPIAFLRKANAPTLGTDAYRAADVWRGDEIWNTNAVTFADLDGDGHEDIIVANYFADGVRLLDVRATGSVPLPRSMSRAYNGGRNRLLLWDHATSGDAPSVTYHDVSNVLADEMLTGWTQAVGAADLDRDGLPEVYFTNDFGPDRLLHNRSTPGQVHLAELQGRWNWTTPPSKILGRDSFKGMGIDFGDVNGDGVPDLYVSNIAVPGVAVESHFLFASEGSLDAMRNGRAPYVDRSGPLGLARSGWAWDSKLADFDNDGVLEALQATGFIQGQIDRWPEVHELIMVSDEVMAGSAAWARFQPGDDVSGHEINPFFVRAASGEYVDIARELQLEPTDTPYVTRGIAIADVDGDGDLDFFIANQWAPFVYYRNDAPRAGAFLGVRPFLLSRTAAGIVRRAAIGATVIAHLPDSRTLVTTVDGGNGHTGRRSADAHIGLGRVDAGQSLPVEIIWRDASGRHTDQLSLQPGWHNVDLPEGSAATRP
jgi:hypothetical protein